MLRRFVRLVKLRSTRNHLKMAIALQTICTWCKSIMDPPQHRLYCSPTCRANARYDRRWEKPEGPREPVPEAQPFSWWVAQANEVDTRCPRCDGPVHGIYIPPTAATVGECAVVAHCRLCGREHVLIVGRAGVPYTQQGVSTDNPLPMRPARVLGGRKKGWTWRTWRTPSDKVEE